MFLFLPSFLIDSAIWVRGIAIIKIVVSTENGEYTEYIYVRGQHFARRDGNLLSSETNSYFYHTDHLGSTVMVTNTSAEIVWSSEYTPFGLLTRQEGEYDFQKAQKFTGKDLDQATGLYYYNARWYYAEIGRFISADSYKGELLNPQTLNLYIYVTNNPLIYVDPDGRRKQRISLHTAYQRIIKRDLEQPVPPNLMSDPVGDFLTYAELALPAYAAKMGDPDLYNYYYVVMPVVAKAYAYYAIADTGGKAAQYTLDSNDYKFREVVLERFEYHMEKGNYDAEIEIRTSFGRVFVDGEKVVQTWNPLEWAYWSWNEFNVLRNEEDRYREEQRSGSGEYYYREYKDYYYVNFEIDGFNKGEEYE